jgi:integrase
MEITGNTVQQYITCVKLFLKWTGSPSAFSYKVSNKDRKAFKQKHLERWFDEKDIEACMNYSFANLDWTEALRYRIIVRLLVETGARVGEIATIKRKDLAMEEKTVFIQGKTEARPVFFSQDTWVALNIYLNSAYDGYYGMDKKISLFPCVDKIKATITTMLEKLGMKNGADGRGPHTFRHYTATQLFYDGNMRIEDIAYLLGDKVETIREKYLHPTPAMLRKRVAAAMGWE